jgi:hypothetical protein
MALFSSHPPMAERIARRLKLSPGAWLQNTTVRHRSLVLQIKTNKNTDESSILNPVF